MVIGLFGESCAGKSTVAEGIAKMRAGEVKIYSGKDYLKLAKSEPEAKLLFTELLRANEESGETVIYVITEPEHLAFLPQKAVRVLVKAELDSIKERFAKRMNGTLPAPVAAMLEKRHGMFDGERHDLCVNTDAVPPEETLGKIARLCDGSSA